MRRIYTVLVVLSVFVNSFLLPGQIREQLTVNPQSISIKKENGFDRILFNGDFLRVEPGAPELPVYNRSYVIPCDASNIQVEIEGIAKQRILGAYTIYPSQPSIPTNGSVNTQFITPNEKIYGTQAAFPGKYVEIVADRIFMGYRIIDIQICPYEYIPKTKELYVCNIDYLLKYTSSSYANNIHVNHSQSKYLYEQNKKLVKQMVDNPESVDKYDIGIMEKNSIGNMTSNTSMNFCTPEYIIITVDSLVESFEPFIEWKRKKGIYAIVESVENIASDNQGNDLQEKIRNYIIFSKEKYGEGMYVLLGGDNHIIPARLVQGDYEPKTSNHKSLFAADMYYATLHRQLEWKSKQ